VSKQRANASLACRARGLRIFAKIGVLSLIPASFLLAKSKFPDYPVREATSYALSAEKAGIAIGIQPVEDPKEERDYFKAELTKQGLIPIFVVIQNKSGEDSFLFDAAKVSYAPLGPVSAGPKESFLHQFLGFGYESDGITGRSLSDVNENIKKKELWSTMVRPGDSVHGFLYLRVEAIWTLGMNKVPIVERGTRPKLRLQLPVTRSGADEPISFEWVL
jgi:hypothetical protein